MNGLEKWSDKMVAFQFCALFRDNIARESFTKAQLGLGI